MPVMKPQELAYLLRPFIFRWFNTTTRYAPMQLVPHGLGNNVAGNAVYNVTTTAGGPASVRWLATGAAVQYKWVQGFTKVPADFANGGTMAIYTRMRCASGTVSIQNWQVYVTTLVAGNGDTWYIAAPDNVGAVTLTTSYQDVTVKAPFGLPASAVPGAYITAYFGPGANAVSWAADVLMLDMWLQYQARY